MTRLSVNINKVATLRNARGGDVPNVVKVALVRVLVLMALRFIRDRTNGISVNQMYMICVRCLGLNLI